MDLKKIKKFRELKEKYKYDIALVSKQFENDQEMFESLLGYDLVTNITDQINEMFQLYQDDEDVDRFRLFILQNMAVLSANILYREKKDLKLLNFFAKVFLETIEQNVLELNKDGKD